MLPLLVLIFLFVVGVVLIIKLIVRFAETLTGKLVTDHFRTAEFILEKHQVPAWWTRRSRGFRSMTKPVLLTHLDKLIGFFETCPFFEDEEARTSLLAQLRAERDDWVAKPLESIITTEK
jgi:hypothetical protein